MANSPDALRPIIVRTVEQLRGHTGQWRRAGQTIGLVPTMGALHDGHISLAQIAKDNADRLIVSIFVNSKQFSPHEDFDRYPREQDADVAKLAAVQADLVFLPSADEMYGEGFATTIHVDDLTRDLCAATRPRLFDGVTTIVTKLLLQTTPDIAVFGEKDYQQLLVIRRLVRDLDIAVTILSGPTKREPDGLAISSRNQYLTPEQRGVAAQLNRILRDTADEIAQGSGIAAQVALAKSKLTGIGFDGMDYLEVRDADTLEPIDRLERPARILGAVWLGTTRLIDNREILPSKSGGDPLV